MKPDLRPRVAQGRIPTAPQPRVPSSLRKSSLVERTAGIVVEPHLGPDQLSPPVLRERQPRVPSSLRTSSVVAAESIEKIETMVDQVLLPVCVARFERNFGPSATRWTSWRGQAIDD